MRKALITGITGQDGSYLAEYLLSLGYEVHGIIRRTSTTNLTRISHVLDQVKIRYADITDAGSLQNAVSFVEPDEIYNFAAMSQVRISYDMPAFTGDVTGLGFTRLLEVVRRVNPKIKIYQASSSEMFGRVVEIPQTEKTPFYPLSPYGCAKSYAFYLGRSYREGYGMNIYNGILFNHESPRRGEQFFSRKVAMAVADIKKGRMKKVKLGNLDAKRDIGYAKEYVEWIWRMVQEPKPDDYVIATGENHSMREFVEEAFSVVGLDWEKYVDYDKDLYRPAEVDVLIGDASKAKKAFGFKPEVKFKELVKIMVDAEMATP